MTIETAADRAVFMSAAGHGITVTWMPMAGGNRSFDAIFDNAFVAVEGGSQAAVTSQAPVLYCRDDDLAGLVLENAVQGDRVDVAGVLYAVTDIQPDGTGMTTVILERWHA